MNLELLLAIKARAAEWVNLHALGIVLDSNQCAQAKGIGKYELILAAGAQHIVIPDQNSFDTLRAFRETHPNSWMFGWFSYDLKNEIERLQSQHPDAIQFAPLCFFIPEKLVVIDRNLNIVEGEHWLNEILATHIPAPHHTPISIQGKTSKEHYIKCVDAIRNHIIEGDVYELNYCVEFFGQATDLYPPAVYESLRQRSPVPFATFLKHEQRYLMGASPERFVCAAGTKIYSQPIKGTARRGRTEAEDEALKNELLHSEKERAENLMIVDLVRNDLARTAQTGSIHVDELFGIYSFAQVHQMISTVSATLQEGRTVVDAIEYAFPMGSMTGAPKVMAMQLIEQYEETKRGLYSGAIGYIDPQGNADFNVVIRSIQYNAHSGYVNFEVGSAITFDSDPESEYQECMLKAKAMMQVLSGS